jgi:polyphenol oxidase
MNSSERIHPSIFHAWPDVVAAMSTRQGGEVDSPFGMNLSLSIGDEAARVERNRRSFFGSLGIDVQELALPGQIHRATVRRVEQPGLYRNCDALVTCTPRVFLCVTVADCLPILMFDPEHFAMAGVHAGWRGTVEGIVGIAIRTMVDQFGTNPQRLVAFIGSGAGPCCYEVGEEVTSRLGPGFVVRRDSRFFADLKAANVALLASAGVPTDSIEVHPSCTICEADRFHSYRRDRQNSGRMMAVIGLARFPLR